MNITMGQGASNLSTQVNQAINSVVNNVLVQSTSSCVANSTNQQNAFVNCNARDVEINQEINNNTTQDCLQKSTYDIKVDSTAKNNLNAKIDQIATNEIAGGLVSVSSNYNTQKNTAINNFTNNVNITTVKSCVATTQNQQNANVNCSQDADTIRINQLIDTGIINKCVQEDVATVQLTNDITNLLIAEGAQKSSTGFGIGGLIGLIVGIIVLIIVIGVVIKIVKSRKSSNSSTAPIIIQTDSSAGKSTNPLDRRPLPPIKRTAVIS